MTIKIMYFALVRNFADKDNTRIRPWEEFRNHTSANSILNPFFNKHLDLPVFLGTLHQDFSGSFILCLTVTE